MTFFASRKFCSRLSTLIVLLILITSCAQVKSVKKPVLPNRILKDEERGGISDPSSHGLLRIRFRGKIQRRWAMQIILDGKEQVVYWPTAFVEGEEFSSVGQKMLSAHSFGSYAPTAKYKSIRPADLRKVNPWDCLGLEKATESELNDRFQVQFEIDNAWERPVDEGTHVLQLQLVPVQLMTTHGMSVDQAKDLFKNVKIFENLRIAPNSLTEIRIKKLKGNAAYTSIDSVEMEANLR